MTEQITYTQAERLSLIRFNPTTELLDGERRTEELLTVKLTDEELIAYGETVGRQRNEIAALEAKLAQQKKEITAAIEAREAVIDAKCQAQLTKSEMRMVECIDLLSTPRAGKKTRIRMDTLDVVGEPMLMTDNELQRMLNFEEREAAKAAEEATTAEQPMDALAEPEAPQSKKRGLPKAE